MFTFAGSKARMLGLLVATAALTAVPTGHAFAASATDSSQFSVTAGSLAFGTAPDVPGLPGLALNGQAQTIDAPMSDWSAIDATGDGAGWSVTEQGDSGTGKSPVFKEYCTSTSDCGSVGYVSSGSALAASSLSLYSSGAAFTAQGGTTGAPPTHQCGSACNLDTTSPVKVASAAVGAGMGTYQANGYDASSVRLSAPTTVKALGAGKVYRADLTWTLSSGP
jgi:hypothetical protein